jgi:hypothetical protein
MGSKEGKKLFFEKKNQKNHGEPGGAQEKVKSFLLLFFKKEVLPFT